MTEFFHFLCLCCLHLCHPISLLLCSLQSPLVDLTQFKFTHRDPQHTQTHILCDTVMEVVYLYTVDVFTFFHSKFLTYTSSKHSLHYLWLKSRGAKLLWSSRWLQPSGRSPFVQFPLRRGSCFWLPVGLWHFLCRGRGEGVFLQRPFGCLTKQDIEHWIGHGRKTQLLLTEINCWLKPQ